jgi:hypothetical protein
MLGWGAAYSFAVADGYVVYCNLYDHQIYSVGRGPSRLTISAPDIGIEMGKTLIIKGTITDIASGTRQAEQTARFPNGVPAVSDDSMSDWMEYVYMQKPKPIETTGVEVTIEVIDSNGNYRPIGKTTSNAEGFYSFDWKPDIPGKFTIIAKFAGTESYWPSTAQTAFVVEEAPPQPTQQPVVAQSPVEMYVIGVGVAIIIAIVIVGALMMMMIRKRQ